MKRSLGQNLREGFRENERLALIFGRLLLAGLIACLAVGIQRLAEQLAVGWQGGYLPWLAGLVALEAVYTTGQVRRSRELDISPLSYRLVEWVVLLFLLKIFFYLRYGLERLVSDLTFIGPGLFSRIFDLEYVFTAVVLLLLWAFTVWTMHDLFEIESATLLLEEEGYEKYFSNCAQIRNALATRLLGIGLGLAAVTAVVQTDLSWLFVQQNGAPLLSLRGSGWYVLAYFVLLILLLAQTNFSTLRASWAWERLPIDRRIASRWLVYGLVMLVGVGVLVSLLPTRYSLSFLEVLRYILEWVITIFIYIFMLIFMAVNFAISWVMSLFGSEYQPPELEEMEELPPLELPEAISETVSGAEFWQSLVFWVLLLGIVGFALYQYIRQNRGAVRHLRGFSLWQRLGGFLGWMSRWLQGFSRGARQSVGAALRSGIERLRSRGFAGRSEAVVNFLNPNRLSPRQRVLFFYLTFVRRSAEAGLPRQPEQTPLEYEQMLSQHFRQSELPGEVEPEQSALDDLTAAFLEARYSRHPIHPEQASRVKAAWAQIRQALRRREE